MSAVLFLSFCPMIFPQEVNNDLTHNMNAVNFYIINGYAVSYKFKNDSDSKYKYRIHLDLSSSFSKSTSDRNNSNKYDNGSSESSENGDGNGSSFYISISPEVYYSIFKTNHANLYIGTGPFLNYNYYKSTSNNSSFVSSTGNKSNYENIYKNTSYSAGILAFAGLEGYITKNISVFSEIYLSGSRSWNSTKENINNESTSGYSNNEYNTNSKGWSCNLSSIRMGVSLYF
jgi:hypothetical protein